jgi:predicted nucleotidyltransferase
MRFPTLYNDVNQILQEFTAHIRRILGDQFVGLYLYGSLALGDFDPQTSDIDFLVVTQAELSPELVEALRTLHAQFDGSRSPWARKVEAAYIPLAALKHPAPANTPYPQVERGTELFQAPLEIGWAFQRYTLRQQGLIVFGPSPVSFTDPVDLDEMRQAATIILGKWQEQARQDRDWIAWLRQKSGHGFVILTICRLLFSLETGLVTSKPDAARWAQDTLDPRWSTLIQGALVYQHEQGEISDLELEETLDFLNQALKYVKLKYSTL